MLKLCNIPISRAYMHVSRLLIGRNSSVLFKANTYTPCQIIHLRAFTTDQHADVPSSSLPPTIRTSGQIWNYIQREKMGKDKDISLLEWTQLVTSTQPNTASDARLIRTALLDLNRCSPRFKLTRTMAKDAVEGMMRSMMPATSTESTEWKQVVEAGLFLGQTLIQKHTGLHVTVETSVLDQHLFQIFYTCLLQQKEGGFREMTAGGPEVQELYAKILEVTIGVVQLLWERCSKPMRQMKKRAARKYKRKLSCTQGPTPTTIDLAVKICIEIMKQGVTIQPNPYPLAVQMVQELESRRWLGLVQEETKMYMAQYAPQ